MLVKNSCFLLYLFHACSSAQVHTSLCTRQLWTCCEASSWSAFDGSLHWLTEGLRKAVCRAIRERERAVNDGLWS